MSRLPFIAGNWKMNNDVNKSLALISDLLKKVPQTDAEVMIAPTFVNLIPSVEAAKGSAVEVIAQNMHFAENGAYTGEVSAEMLKDVGVDVVLIGHSERSLYFNEKNDIQRHKIENVLAVGLTPLLCVGESLKEREDGREKEAVAYQLSVLKGLKTDCFAVAYEPVWAIGTGKVANKEQIADMHAFIYSEILSLCGNDAKIRVLYGGSVNPANAADIFAVPHVDGALVGGASLTYEAFSDIIRAAEQA